MGRELCQRCGRDYCICVPIGNPQLGLAKDMPLENRGIHLMDGTRIGTLSECFICGGLYYAICPCTGMRLKNII